MSNVETSDVELPRKAVAVSGLSVLLLRVMLSGIFITAGLQHIIGTDELTVRAEAPPLGEWAGMLGDTRWLVLASGYGLLIGGTALRLGVYPRWAATGLLIMLIPITITVQVGVGILHGPRWKNIALFGALLFFVLNDFKRYRLDNK